MWFYEVCPICDDNPFCDELKTLFVQINVAVKMLGTF